MLRIMSADDEPFRESIPVFEKINTPSLPQIDQGALPVVEFIADHEENVVRVPATFAQRIEGKVQSPPPVPRAKLGTCYLMICCERCRLSQSCPHGDIPPHKSL